MAHEHGPHTCYCPSCGFEKEVDAYARCNSETCPVCGDQMRAKETGEYRVSAGQQISQGPSMWPVLIGTLAVFGAGIALIAAKAKK